MNKKNFYTYMPDFDCVNNFTSYNNSIDTNFTEFVYYGDYIKSLYNLPLIKAIVICNLFDKIKLIELQNDIYILMSHRLYDTFVMIARDKGIAVPITVSDCKFANQLIETAILNECNITKLSDCEYKIMYEGEYNLI